MYIITSTYNQFIQCHCSVIIEPPASLLYTLHVHCSCALLNHQHNNIIIIDSYSASALVSLSFYHIMLYSIIGDKLTVLVYNTENGLTGSTESVGLYVAIMDSCVTRKSKQIFIVTISTVILLF